MCYVPRWGLPWLICVAAPCSHPRPLPRRPLQAWDQNVFNWVAHEGLLPFQSPPENERLVRQGSSGGSVWKMEAGGLQGGGWEGCYPSSRRQRAGEQQGVEPLRQAGQGVSQDRCSAANAPCARVAITSPPASLLLQVWGTNHSLVFGVLPVAAFASGHTFFVQRLFELQKVKPYVVHCTFQARHGGGSRARCLDVVAARSARIALCRLPLHTPWFVFFHACFALPSPLRAVWRQRRQAAPPARSDAVGGPTQVLRRSVCALTLALAC